MQDRNEEIKLLFFGSDIFPSPILRKLGHSKQIKVTGLVTSTSAQYSTVSSQDITHVAKQLKIPVFYPQKFTTASKKILQMTSPDIILVCNYGQILPKDLLDYPRYAALNIHASLLPVLRGACPIEMAVLQGLSTTGLSVQLMEEKLDTGDIIFQKEIQVSPTETGRSLRQKLQRLAADTIEKVLIEWVSGDITPAKQEEARATYCYRSDSSTEAARIDWSNSAVKIERKIRAFNPYPGAWTHIHINSFGQKKRLKILQSKVAKGDKRQAIGNSIRKDNTLFIQTGHDMLLPLKVQLEGKQIMPIAAFLCGVRDTISFK